MLEYEPNASAKTKFDFPHKWTANEPIHAMEANLLSLQPFRINVQLYFLYKHAGTPLLLSS